MPVVDEAETYRIQNKEILLLVALALGATGVFVFTKSMAIKEANVEARIARVWYQEGQHQFASGKIELAIDSFRKATSESLNDRTYSIALANALAAGNHNAEAEETLLSLRESDPENAEINIQLARLSVKTGNVDDATRYYRNAIYGRWTGSQVDTRIRQLRIELIHVLIAHKMRNMALSELLILETDLPQTAPAHLEVARLFSQADEKPQALTQYDEAIYLDKNDVASSSEAGDIAFQLGDYRRAERYLQHALQLNPSDEKNRHVLSVVTAILADDPLARGLTRQQSRERLISGLEQALQRLHSTFDQRSIDRRTDLQTLDSQARALEFELRSKHLPEEEQVSSGVELVFRIEQATSGKGPQPEVMDTALLLIGQKHHGAQP